MLVPLSKRLSKHLSEPLWEPLSGRGGLAMRKVVFWCCTVRVLVMVMGCMIGIEGVSWLII